MTTTTVDCDAARAAFPQFHDLTDAEICEVVAFVAAALTAALTDLTNRRTAKPAA